MPPLGSYLSYAGQAGARLWDLVRHPRYLTSLTGAESELVMYVAARAANLHYIWTTDCKLGLAAGTRGGSSR